MASIPAAPRSASRLRFPMALPPAELLDMPPVHIPASAATPDGFRAWMMSGARPGHCQLCHAGDRIFVELLPSLLLLEMPTSALRSLDGFCAWATSPDFPEHGRISYLEDEVVIDMSPEEIETHNKVKAAVTITVGTLNEELDLGELLTDRALFQIEGARVGTEPDASLVRWETSEAGLARFFSRTGEQGRYTEIRGRPDWVVEIVSRSSVHKDRQRLRTLYHRAGIPEYWLIDARGAEIEFQILVWRKKGYVAVRPRQGWYRSPLFGRSFRLERRRNRVGRWQYKLHVQAD
jgi:Uma2 family endonuclease